MSAFVHWAGQADVPETAETDDPRDVTCTTCRTMMICGGVSPQDMEPRPRSMAEAYAALRKGERRVLSRPALRRGVKRRRRT